MKRLPEGFSLFLKKACPTCVLIEPLIQRMSDAGLPLTVYSQDDPLFPTGFARIIDDVNLEYSFHQRIETVPTLILTRENKEVARLAGWHREEWQALTGLNELGADLPGYRPGCGALNMEPGKTEELALQFGAVKLAARRIEVATMVDEMETCFEKGWTDGLPGIPPTPQRVVSMLQGTRRQPDEIVGVIPPNNVACSVEKVAINAVMAGCKPEYLPVVLATVEAACLDEFCMHGLLATTYFSSPVVIVNGPIRQAIQMNSGVNALGQGNRANATIGRALQLVIRNIGGGVPGGVDRATLGSPGKFTFCFAEDEENSPWESLSVQKGYAPDTSTVTLFPGHGVHEIFDQLSRTPESLARSMAGCLATVVHPKISMAADAVVVVCPEHVSVFKAAGWSKQRLLDELHSLLQMSGRQAVRGADGIAEGLPESFAADPQIPKFKTDGLMIVHAGGPAGKFSAVISGWVASGATGSQTVTKEIE